MERTDVRLRLVDAARSCFAAKGYHATSVQEIVERAAVTKGAFYHYFASKDDLLWLLHEQFIAEELALADGLRQAGGSPVRRLKQLILDLVQSIGKYRENVRVLCLRAHPRPLGRGVSSGATTTS